MSNFIFFCPFCDQKFDCDETWENQKVECPTCKKNISLTKTPLRHNTQFFTCPYCNKEIAHKDDLKLHQWFKCPFCSKEVFNDSYIEDELNQSPAKHIFIPQLYSQQEKPAVSKKQVRETERCPYCDELISASAIICPHCREHIFRCPQCGALNNIEYIGPEKEFFKLVKSYGGAILGGISGSIFGPIGAFFGAMLGFVFGGGIKPKNVKRCKRCGCILK